MYILVQLELQYYNIFHTDTVAQRLGCLAMPPRPCLRESQMQGENVYLSLTSMETICFAEPQT